MFGKRGHRGWMRPALLAAVALGLALGISGGGAPAAAEDLPSAESILQKAIDATGGADALKKLENRYMKGSMEIAAMGLKAAMSTWSARPASTYTLMESPALGQMLSGGDGTWYWEANAMTGPKVKDGEELALARREADFDGLTNWRAWFQSAATAGVDTVDGRVAWKVTMTPKEGSPETWCFDQETGLQVKASMKVKTDQGTFPVDVFFTDYREVDGLKIPFRMKQSVMNGMQVMDFATDSVAHNVTIPDGRFDPPAEIKALIEKKKAGAAPPAETPADEGPAPATGK